MKITDAIAHFGSQREIAKVLLLTEAAVSKWKDYGEDVPLKNALKLADISDGEIDLRLKDYR